jgi:hypothetical protein
MPKRLKTIKTAINGHAHKLEEEKKLLLEYDVAKGEKRTANHPAKGSITGMIVKVFPEKGTFTLRPYGKQRAYHFFASQLTD